MTVKVFVGLLTGKNAYRLRQCNRGEVNKTTAFQKFINVAYPEQAHPVFCSIFVSAIPAC
jgi:hypothetical protein